MTIYWKFLIITFLFLDCFKLYNFSCEFKKSVKLKKFDRNRKGFLEVKKDSIVVRYFDLDIIKSVIFKNVNTSSALFETAEISRTSSTKIEDEAFSGLKNLKSLILHNNFLTEITKTSFSALNKLQKLDLSSNLISTLYPHAFSELESLFFLYLNDNCITSLDMFHFTSKEFQKIDLSNNFIKTFPKLQNADRIHELYLGGNDIEVLNFRKYFSVLDLLNVTNNKIYSIVSDNLTPIVHSIKILDVSNNNITNTHELAEFINLNKLDLSQNPIDYHTNIDFLIRYKQLKSINLTDTNLTDFRAVNYANADLDMLSIARNPLKIDFEVIGKFEKLTTVEFQQEYCYHFNNYKTISEQFPILKNVKIIYDYPKCKCLKKQKGTYRLYMIKFQTDWHHCSDACSTNGQLTFVIVFTALNILLHY